MRLEVKQLAKRIVVWSKAAPDEGGYGDYVKVFDGENIIYEGPCSAAPDPYDRDEGPEKPWNKTYGWLAPGIYRWQKQDDGKRSWGYLHLYVNDGEPVPSRNPNPNQKKNANLLDGVSVHTGFTYSRDPKLKGSNGCITFPPDDWDNFIAKLELNEAGTLEIIDASDKKQAFGEPINTTQEQQAGFGVILRDWDEQNSKEKRVAAQPDYLNFPGGVSDWLAFTESPLIPKISPTPLLDIKVFFGRKETNGFDVEEILDLPPD
jgi:hypothetical protein